MKSGGRSSPSPARSLVEHQRSPVCGWIARPTQLRRPVAKIRRLRPSGSTARTSARLSSLAQAAPSPWTLSQLRIASALLLGNPCAAFDADPTETNIRPPSAGDAGSRAPRPPAGGGGASVSRPPPALRWPLREGGATTEWGVGGKNEWGAPPLGGES